MINKFSNAIDWNANLNVINFVYVNLGEQSF